MSSEKDWSPLKSLIRFQIRLLFDAVRDFVLSPVSITCAIIDILAGTKSKKDSTFYRLMLLGRDSDRMIDLFGEFEEAQDKGIDQSEPRKIEIKTNDKPAE